VTTYNFNPALSLSPISPAFFQSPTHSEYQFTFNVFTYLPFSIDREFLPKNLLILTFLRSPLCPYLMCYCAHLPWWSPSPNYPLRVAANPCYSRQKYRGDSFSIGLHFPVFSSCYFSVRVMKPT
jgi:hypothetical protein